MTSSSSVTSPDEMIASFPNSVLPKITSEPHYKNLRELRDALKENYSRYHPVEEEGRMDTSESYRQTLSTISWHQEPRSSSHPFPANSSSHRGQILSPQETSTATMRRRRGNSRNGSNWSVQGKRKLRIQLAKRL